MCVIVVFSVIVGVVISVVIVIVMCGVICMIVVPVIIVRMIVMTVVIMAVLFVPVVVVIIVAVGLKQGVFADIEPGCHVRLQQGQNACVGRKGFDSVVHPWREIFANPHHDIRVLEGGCLGRA